MRLAFVRRVLVAVVAFAALASSPSVARAGDHYSGDDVAVAAAAMPEGWKLLGSAEAGADQGAVKDAILAAAKDTGVTDKLQFVLRTATCPGGSKVVFALVDAEAKAEDVLAALKAGADTKGWTVRDLGDPTVILVVSAPAEIRAAAVDAQTGYAAKMLAIKAEAAYENANPPRAEALTKSIAKIDPKNAIAAYVSGQLAFDEAGQVARSQGVDAPKLFKEAAAQFAKAVSKDATGPLSPVQRTRAHGLRGQALLQAAAGAPSVEARAALKEASAGLEDPAIERRERIGFRYDLACAHGRLKEIDDAFKHLTAVLEEHAKSPMREISHWKDGDPDFNNLKTDPRWEELVKKYGAIGGNAQDE